MSYLVLARKWRPQRFADLTGQDVIVRTLKNALTSNHLAHAYLMTGIRGVGKTTISRLMAMAVNCHDAHDGEPCGKCEVCLSIAKGNNLDVQEMDAASHTGVDDIREILDGVRYPPAHLKIKVYIIDEAHMLSKSAFNALLKTLEEPPERVLFILATTESDKLPITVRSRCQRFDLRRLNIDEISNHLAYVLGEEKISAQAEALQIIARASDGSVRDALSLTERVLAFSNENITIHDVQQSLGLIGFEHTRQLANAILAGHASDAVQTLRAARELGVSPVQLLKSLSEAIHEMSCCKLDSNLIPQGSSPEMQKWFHAQAECWSNEALDIRYQALIHGLRDINIVDEQRGAEMIVMRLAHLNTISPPLKAFTDTEKKNLKFEAPASTPVETTTIIPPIPEPIAEKKTVEPVAAQPAEEEIIPEEPAAPPQNWEEAVSRYHEIKPGIAAILEHVICESFEPAIKLLLKEHQMESLESQDRKQFEAWLQRDISWVAYNDEIGESIIEKQTREAEEYERKLWQQAEADPYVQAIKETFDCRLVDVEPPSTFTDDEEITLEERD